jgi:hypothetical protein
MSSNTTNLNSKISSLAYLILIGAIVLVVSAFTYPNIKKYLQMSKEMSSITRSLPSNFHKIHQSFSPKELDNEAILTADFTVSGTRQAIYSQVVKSLGINVDSSDSQELDGIHSPNYANSFWLIINPEESVTTEFKLCPNTESDPAFHACLNSTPGHGENFPAKSIELEIVGQ